MTDRDDIPDPEEELAALNHAISPEGWYLDILTILDSMEAGKPIEERQFAALASNHMTVYDATKKERFASSALNYALEGLRTDGVDGDNTPVYPEEDRSALLKLVSSAYLALDRPSDAIRMFTQPELANDCVALVRLGDSLLIMKKPGYALETFKKATQVNPHNLDAYEGILRVLSDRRDRGGLESTIQEMREKNPQSSVGVASLAKQYSFST